VGWAWPTNLTKWLRKEGHFPKGGMSIKVGKRYSALSYTKAFGWSQKHFLVDPSFFFSFFFPQISSLHHVQLLFLPIFGLSIIFIFIKKHSGWIT
jgi:hypothetical protein